MRGGRPESHPGPPPTRGAARGVPAASPPPAEAWGDWGDEMLSLEEIEESGAKNFVFHCTRATEMTCLQRSVFGTRDNPTNRKKIQSVNIETKIYLFNIETKRVHGPYTRQGSPGVIDSDLFGGRFNLQLKVAASSSHSSFFLSRSLKFGQHTRLPAPVHVPLVPSQLFAAAAAAAAETKDPDEPAGATETKDAELPLLDLSESVESTLKLKFEPCFYVDSFLRSLNLERYIEVFDAAEVDFKCLKTLSEQDLRAELGLPFGPARTICNALRVHDEQTSASATSSDLSSSIRWLTDGSV